MPFCCAKLYTRSTPAQLYWSRVPSTEAHLPSFSGVIWFQYCIKSDLTWPPVVMLPTNLPPVVLLDEDELELLLEEELELEDELEPPDEPLIVPAEAAKVTRSSLEPSSRLRIR